MNNTLTWKLTESQKAEIVAKLATGKFRIAELANEYGLTKGSVSKLRKRRGNTFHSTKETLARVNAEAQKAIIAKGYILIERKLDKALTDNKSFEAIRLDHLTKALSDLWKHQEVESLKPIRALHQYKSMDELELSIQRDLVALETMSGTELLEWSDSDTPHAT